MNKKLTFDELFNKEMAKPVKTMQIKDLEGAKRLADNTHRELVKRGWVKN
jgi:hypothetical protein